MVHASLDQDAYIVYASRDTRILCIHLEISWSIYYARISRRIDFVCVSRWTVSRYIVYGFRNLETHILLIHLGIHSIEYNIVYAYLDREYLDIYTMYVSRDEYTRYAYQEVYILYQVRISKDIYYCIHLEMYAYHLLSKTILDHRSIYYLIGSVQSIS